MYAAILTEQPNISFETIKEEIEKLGYQVLSQQIEDVDDIPRNVYLWLQVAWTRLTWSPQFPILGYVRITQQNHNGKTQFATVLSPWWARLYYSVLMWGMFWWVKIQRSFSHG